MVPKKLYWNTAILNFMHVMEKYSSRRTVLGVCSMTRKHFHFLFFFCPFIRKMKEIHFVCVTTTWFVEDRLSILLVTTHHQSSRFRMNKILDFKHVINKCKLKPRLMDIFQETFRIWRSTRTKIWTTCSKSTLLSTTQTFGGYK